MVLVKEDKKKRNPAKVLRENVNLELKKLRNKCLKSTKKLEKEIIGIDSTVDDPLGSINPKEGSIEFNLKSATKLDNEVNEIKKKFKEQLKKDGTFVKEGYSTLKFVKEKIAKDEKSHRFVTFEFKRVKGVCKKRLRDVFENFEKGENIVTQ